MADSPKNPPPAAAPRAAERSPTTTAPAQRRWGVLAVRTVVFLIAGAGVWWLISGWSSGRVPPTAALTPIALMVLVAAGGLWQEWYWRRPRRLMLDRLQEILAGKMPIDSLRDIKGGMRPTADAAAEIFRHARILRRQLAEQDAEMSQKVANRTDALQRVIASLRMQAIRDPLTNLFNRRALDELLPRLIDICSAKGEDLSVMMMDVNHFKQLNDQLGHPAGDEMLRNLGQLIRSSLTRPADTAFRCGGDEFVVVLPGCPHGRAQELADSLTTLVGSYARTVKSNPKPGLSIGVCSISELPSPLPAELLREADRRLYAEKHRSKRTVGAA